MDINWVVNVYEDVDGNKYRVDQIKFGNRYKNARKYYWENKHREREQGRYLELVPYKN